MIPSRGEDQPTAGRRRAGGRALLLLASLLASSALAQAPPASPPAPAPAAAPNGTSGPAPPVTAIPIAEVLPRADLALARLRDLEATAARPAAVQEIAAGLESVREDLIAQAVDTRRSLETTRSLDALRSLDASWRRRQSQLTDWSSRIAKRAAELDAAYAEAEGLREIWRVTEGAARAERDVPRALLARIDEVQAAITKARRALSTERLAVLELQEGVGHELARSEQMLGDLAAKRVALERELLVRESLPLWTALGEAMQREPLEVSVERALGAQVAQFSAAWPPPLQVWLAIFGIGAASVWLVFTFRHRAARVAAEDRTFEPTAGLFERPYAVATVLAILGLRLVWIPMPVLAEDVLRTVLLIPALRLLDQVVGPPARRAVLTLAAFYVVDRVRVVLEDAPHVERLVFAGEMAAACAVLLWIRRPARVRELPTGVGGLALLGRGLQVALGLCAASLVANLIGYVRLAFVLGDGALRSIVAAVFIYATYRVADGIVAAARRAWPLTLIHAIRHRPFGSRERTRSVLRAIALTAWALLTLEFFTVRDEVVAGARALLSARLELGELSVSLGDVAAFGITIWLALLVSRAIRFVLQEDVFPRMRLPRGVPNAISATVQYTTVLVAFFLALAAAGIDLTRFAILAGAFGVGVGFGLQNVVNGFVSGLILLYERPVQIGDIVQVADVQGTMRRIGIRSSTVRTFDGAEVIVPNSSLISERVTNWTLSDRQRRIELEVGVEYGNDPERVLRLLTDVAKAHPSILHEPAPLALFDRFGSSSLDFRLRAWTENADDAAMVRSQLGVEIFKALAAAGIAIPFPIYDVRLQRTGA